MSPGDSSRHERVLRRNVAVTGLGILARGVHVVLFLCIGSLWGPAILGHFLLGMGLFEIAAAVVVTGFSDGTMLLVSRRHGPASDEPALVDELANVLATALWVGGGIALALALMTAALAGSVAVLFTGPYAKILPDIALLSWALLPMLVMRVAFAATTAFLRLEWEAIAGSAGGSLLLLLTLPIVRAMGGGLRTLFTALLIAQIIMAVVAVLVLRRHVPIARLWAALRRRRFDRGLLRFALPQSLNMAATTYLARLDVLMLAAFGVPAAVVGAYGTVAALILELRQARMLISGALGPLVARDHARGAHAAIATTLARSAGWAASLAVPLVLGFVAVRHDVLGLLAPGYGGDSRFALILLLGPLVNCLGGLAGNFLVYLLHNRWNLANSLLVATMNTVLCAFLIPRFGITGAALAATVGMAAVTILENVELAALEGMHIALDALARPVLALLAGGGLLWATNGIDLFARWELRVDLAIGLSVAAALFVGGWPKRLVLPQVGRVR